MRIAHVSDCYLPRTGGIETQVRSLALAQLARGDAPRIITATPAAAEPRGGRSRIDDLPVDRITVRLPGDLPVHPRTRAHVVDLLRDEPVDVVHIHLGAVSPFAWGALRATAEMGLPTVVTVHSMWGPLSQRGYRVARTLLGRPGCVVSAVSGVAARAVSEALGWPVEVLPNGIDPVPWRHAHPVPRVTGRLRVVTVARLAPRKRIPELIRALARARVLLEADVHLDATVIGDGPLRTRIERLARGLDLDIRFTGRLDADGIRAVFGRSDAFVQASVRESFGIAALEARTFGLPVIARSQSGTSEFIHDGIEGLLAPDDRRLADAIVHLGRDQRLGERIATHNVEVEPRETWPIVCGEASRLYLVAGA